MDNKGRAVCNANGMNEMNGMKHTHLSPVVHRGPSLSPPVDRKRTRSSEESLKLRREPEHRTYHKKKKKKDQPGLNGNGSKEEDVTPRPPRCGVSGVDMGCL